MEKETTGRVQFLNNKKYKLFKFVLSKVFMKNHLNCDATGSHHFKVQHMFVFIINQILPFNCFFYENNTMIYITTF